MTMEYGMNQALDLGDKTSLRSMLENIEYAIKQSYVKDINAIQQMNELISIQEEILNKDTFESYFQSQEDFQYFINQFTEEIISNILKERPVPGQNGDDIALTLLTNYILFYTKFHNENQLIPFWNKIRNIFKSSAHYFLQGNTHQYGQLFYNPKRTLNADEFNASIPHTEKEFKINDRCDIYYLNQQQHNDISKHCFLRGTITNVDDTFYYLITDISDIEIHLNKQSFDVLPEGELTKDWDWRLNLKKYDIVDCFLNGKYRPATILSVQNLEEEEGVKYVNRKYVIGYRILIDKCNNYKSYAKYYDDGDNEKIDKSRLKYIGDSYEFDEVIDFFDLRLQKPHTKIKEIKRTNSQSSNSYRHMNYNQYFPYSNRSYGNLLFSGDNTEDEEDDILQKISDYFYNYLNADNSKNYIIGKKREFSYYYASLLQSFANKNGYEDLLKILSDEKINGEDIYTLFFILNASLPYLHKNYLIDNYNTITQGALKYIDNLSSNDMRNLKKELSDLIIQVITRIESKIGTEKINEIYKGNESRESGFNLVDEFTLKIGLKMINSSIFDKRLQGVKLLNDYLKNNKDNDVIVSKVLQLMKQNNVIQEIFGVNSHSQIIAKSHDIIAIILEKQHLTQEDLNLILSGTQKGDLDGKLTIMNMLKDLSHYFSSEQRQHILDFIYKHIDISNIKEKEIEVIHFLSQSSDNKNDVINCVNFFMECIMQCKVLSGDKTNTLFIEKLNEIAIKNKNNLIQVFSECVKALKSNINAVMCYKILLCILNKLNQTNISLYNNNTNINEAILIKETFEEYFKDDNDLVTLYKDNFLTYKAQAKELFNTNKIEDKNKILIDGFTHIDNISIRLLFIIIISNRNDFNTINFLIQMLYKEPVCESDHDEFFKFSEKFLQKQNTFTVDKKQHDLMISELFKLFSDNKLFNINNINDISLRVFSITFLYYNIQKEKILIKDTPLSSYENNQNTFYSNKSIDSILNKCELQVEPDELEGFDILWNIIFTSTHQSIANEALKLLQTLFNNNNKSDLLLSKCMNAITNASCDDLFNYKKYFSIINTMFLDSESKGVPIIKAHNDLLKENIFTFKINFIERRTISEPDIYMNTTISEIKINIAQQSDCEYNDIIIEYNNDLVPNNFNCIPASKIFTDKKEDVIIKFKEHKKEDLIDFKTGQPTPKYLSIINEWFDMFSEEKQRMTLENIRAFTETVTSYNKTVDITDSRVVGLLEKYSSKEVGYITRDHFLDFYITAAKNKPGIVWENLVKMDYRENLTKKVVPTNVEVSIKDNYPRYQLGNNEAFLNSLFELFNKVNTQEIKTDIFDFVMNLCTNDTIYLQILTELNENSVLFYNKNELIDLYKMHIIESIVEDVKFENKLNIQIYGVAEEKSNDLINNKKQWIQMFYDSGQFIKLISYICELLKKIYKQNNKDNITILCLNYAMKLFYTFFYLTIKNNLNSNNEQESTANNEENNMGLPTPPQTPIKDEENYIDNHLDNCASFKTLNIIYNNNNEQQTLLNNHLLQLMNELMPFLLNTLEQSIENTEMNNINKFDIKSCFIVFISILIYNQNIFEAIQNSDNEEIHKKLLHSLISKCLMLNHPSLHKFFNKTLLYFTQLAYDNKTYSPLFYLYNICLLLFKDLLCKNDSSPNNSKETSFTLFFDYLTSLYEKIGMLRTILPSNIVETYIKQYNIESDEFIIDLYDSVVDYILCKNKEQQKISSDLFIGIVKLLIKGIKNNSNTKSILFSKKRNDISIFDELIKFVIPSDDKPTLNENNQEINEITNTFNDNSTQQNNEFIPLNVISNESDENKTLLNQKKYLCEFISTLIEDNTLYSTEYFIRNSKYINDLISNYEKEKTQNQQQEATSNYYREMMHHSESSRGRNEGYVGLKNLGCICYMNSIMQQIYMVPTFRYAILQSDDHKEMNTKIFDDNLLHQLQRMYTYLLLSQKEYYNPKMFCSALKDMDGNATNVLVQQDSQEFLNSFCDKIENHLKETEFKYIINDVFVGRTCSQVICDSCNHVSNRFEDFYNLTLEVKNINNLNESLEKMIAPEKIGDFNCEHCKNKVTITKRTTLSDLPNILIVHLRRFWMNYDELHTEKINSSFTFPSEINLKKFCLEDLMSVKEVYETDEIYYKEDDYYEYTLKGVTVHIGSADGGHYFSFININREKEQQGNNKETWLKFNDSHISKFDVKEIPDECFGGSKELGHGHQYENCQNAYLLIYERKLKNPIRYVHKNKQQFTNVVEYNENERNKIKKENDISRKQSNVNRNELISDLEKKVFHDLQKDEFYIYRDFYSLDKKVPLCYYNQVQNDNKQFLRNQNKDNSFYNLLKKIEYDFKQHTQEHPEIILNKSDDIKESLCEMTINKLFMLLSCSDNSEESVSKILYDLNIYFTILTQLMGGNVVNLTKFFSFLEKSSRFEILATLDRIYLPFIEQLFIFLGTFLEDNINNDNTKHFSHKIIKLVLSIFTPGNMTIYTKSDQFLPPFYALLSTCIKYINDEMYSQIQKNFNIINFLIKSLINMYKESESQKDDFMQDKDKDKYKYYSNIICDSLFSFIMRLNIYNQAQYIPNESKPYLNNNNALIHINDILPILNELESEMFLNALIHINISYYKNIILLLYTYPIKIIPNETIRIFKEIEQSDSNEQKQLLYSIIFSLIQIKDNKTIDRFNNILGYPEINIEYTNNKDHIWPLFGYELYKRDNKSMYKYLTSNHIENKYSLLQILNDNFNYEVSLSLLKITVEHYGLFKYLYLMPSNAMKYNNYYENLIKQCEMTANNETDETKRNEMVSEIENIVNKNKTKEEKVVKYVNEFLSKEKGNDKDINNSSTFANKESEEVWELPGWKGYLTNMIPKYIVKENIRKLLHGYDIMFYVFEYITTVIEIDLLNPSKKLLEELENDNNIKEDQTEHKQSTITSDTSNEIISNVSDNINTDNENITPTEEGTFKSQTNSYMSNQLTFNVYQRGYNEKRFIKQLTSLKLSNNKTITFINPKIDQNNNNVITISRFSIINFSSKRGSLSFTKQKCNNTNTDNYFIPNIIIDSLIQYNYRDGFIIHSFRTSQHRFNSDDVVWSINLNIE